MQVSWKGSADDDPGPVQVTAVQVQADLLAGLRGGDVLGEGGGEGGVPGEAGGEAGGVGGGGRCHGTEEEEAHGSHPGRWN